MFKIVVLSLIIAFISTIIIRCYDKFYNKQYEKRIYLNNFFQVLISCVLVLYVDNHFSNSELHLGTTSLQGSGSKNNNSQTQYGGNNKNLSTNNIFTDISNKLKFDTGVPNF